MNIYQVEIEETYERVVTIEAATPEDAVRKICASYKAGSIVLDNEDYVDTRIDLYEDA